MIPIVKLVGLLNLLSGFIALIVVVMVYRQRKSGGHPFLLWLFISAAWWNLSLFMESLSTTLNSHIFWTAFSYPGNMFAPVLLFFFLYHYTHFNRSIPKTVQVLLMIIPTLSCMFVWHSRLRGMVWNEVTLSETPWGFIAHFEHNWWYYIEAYYSYTLIALGLYYLIRGFSLFPHEYNKQVRLLLVAASIPLLLNLVYTLNSSWFYGLDITSVAFTLSSSLFFLTIRRYQLLNITPVAWNTVVDNILDGVIVVIKNRIVGFNPAARDILKNAAPRLREGDFVRESTMTIDRFADFFEDPVKLKEEFIIGDRHFEVSKNPLADRTGSSQVIIFHDITEIKIKEAEIRSINRELVESNSTKDMLFKVVSHDLRGPIGTLVSYLKMLVERDEPMDKKNLEVLFKTSVNASFLIENLLFWAISQGKDSSIHLSLHSISTTLSRALDSLSYQANQKEIRIMNNCSTELKAYYNAPSVEIIFRNLISNSIKFSFPGNTITITSAITGDQVSVTIADTGKGISQETIRSITENIAVKSERGTMLEMGTGIGLTLCMKMIRVNKGKIEISSQPGEGTTVTVFLPLRGN